MNQENKKSVWKFIQNHGDYLKDKLESHPNHPRGRNPYAHICSLINQNFKCSYKDVSDNHVEVLKRFIAKIDK